MSNIPIEIISIITDYSREKYEVLPDLYFTVLKKYLVKIVDSDIIVLKVKDREISVELKNLYDVESSCIHPNLTRKIGEYCAEDTSNVNIYADEIRKKIYYPKSILDEVYNEEYRNKFNNKKDIEALTVIAEIDYLKTTIFRYLNLMEIMYGRQFAVDFATRQTYEKYGIEYTVNVSLRSELLSQILKAI